MRLRDGKADYGWISIGLHWIGVVLVWTMLFVGDSIGGPGAELQSAMLKLHTTIGLSLYAVFWARVLWRAKVGHPQPLPRQKRLYYRVGKVFHYLLLAGIAAMLISGPLMAWSGAIPLRLFDLVVPSPIPESPGLFAAMRGLHAAGAAVLGWGSLVHVMAVIKHTVVDRDGALDKIMVPLEKPGLPPTV